MLRITEIIDIDAPASLLWQEIAKLDQVQHYVTSVTRSVYSSEQKEGVGAQRVCDVQGFGTLTETIVDWKEGETLAYAIEGMPSIVKNPVSRWHLVAKNERQTTLRVTMTLETRYGPVGKVMEKLALKPQLTSALRGLLAEFKAYAESSATAPSTGGPALHAHVA